VYFENVDYAVEEVRYRNDYSNDGGMIVLSCSDGLFDVVDNERFARFVGSKEELSDICRAVSLHTSQII
jgi:serine/threonine protein phosphatase PrpC